MGLGEAVSVLQVLGGGGPDEDRAVVGKGGRGLLS